MLGLCYKRLQLVVARNCSIAAVDSVNQFHCFLKGPLFSSSFSSTSILLGGPLTHDKAHSFTVSYLTGSFGFSPELALSVSKKQGAKFKSAEKPNLVVEVLKEYGFSDAHISQIVEKRIELLKLDARNILLPKLEFFNSIGISGTVLAKMLCSLPSILTLSLERSLKPFYDMSITLGIPKENLPYYFRNCGRIFKAEELRNVPRNVLVLRAHGVPESSFPLWVGNNAKALSFDSEKVEENVHKVISMGFCPKSPTFMKALYVISVTDASKWKKKVEFYKKCGWNEDGVLLAFKRNPVFMYLSEKNILKKMDFYLNKMGLKPADVARSPCLLTFSLEKRIIPRCSVLRVIQLKGLCVDESLSICTILQRNEKWFLENLVLKYQDQVPELMSISEGKTSLADLSLEFDGRVESDASD